MLISSNPPIGRHCQCTKLGLGGLGSGARRTRGIPTAASATATLAAFGRQRKQIRTVRSATVRSSEKETKGTKITKATIASFEGNAEAIADPAKYRVWEGWEWYDWGIRYVRRRHLEPVPFGFARDSMAMKRLELTRKLEEMIAAKCAKFAKRSEIQQSNNSTNSAAETGENVEIETLCDSLAFELEQLAGKEWASRVAWWHMDAWRKLHFGFISRSDAA